MKVFIALLACVVAANAATYVMPSCYTYHYFCQHNYYIAPPTSCYSYCSYFPRTWCHSSYYAPILKVYPGDDCNSHCWRERSVSDITNELKNLLKSSLANMTSKMYRNRDAFCAKLDSIHAAYKYYYKKYLYMYYGYRYSHCTYYNYYDERNRKLSAYCAQLDAKKASVIASFNAAIARNIAVIKAFHDKLVKNATDCLNTRLSKISQFRSALSKKVNEYVSKFISTQLAIVYKNKMHLRATFERLFCGEDWWLGYKAKYALYDYYYREKSKVYRAASAYRCKLNTFMNKIISYYTCAYKCYMSNGCLSYGSKYYQSHCKSLGRWYVYAPCMRYDLYCLAPLKFKFTPCHYHHLKTCDVDAAAGDISGVIAGIKSKRDQFIKDFDAKYHTFRCTWVSNFYKYKYEFIRIVNIRHNFLCEYQRYLYIRLCGYLSIAQRNHIAQMKKDLLARASRVCYQYYQCLLARLYQADKAHAAAKARFNASVDQLIAKITATFEACKSKRSASIAAYKKKLEESRNAQRSALSSKLNKAKSDHLHKFHVMLTHYYGSCYWKYYYSWAKWMRSCYVSLMCRRVRSVLYQFDAFWRTMIPKLVMHYACCYKCNVKAYFFPKCASVPCWTYRLPCHQTYTYKYSCFCLHYHKF